MCGVTLVMSLILIQQKECLAKYLQQTFHHLCPQWYNRNLTFESVIDNRKASVSILFLKEAHTDQTKQSYPFLLNICFIFITYFSEYEL